MSNLGGYQTIVNLAKKAGGPGKLVGIIAVGGFGLIRAGEAGTKKLVEVIKKRSAPFPTQGQTFLATFGGECGGAKIHRGNEYRVLEGDGDSILIEILGDPGSPYVVSSSFLRSVSDYPKDDAAGGK